LINVVVGKISILMITIILSNMGTGEKQLPKGVE
jgi:hypothetical protein